ncbi:glycosyltransferase family 2 protein [Sphingobium herbicidovorans]|uniref:glycosyltransferase family 2 protein n=1 Tax=Sphingobium herbicidovorans TaxID=76947 RepID=UPI003908A509
MQVQDFSTFSEIVICDDASDEPISLESGELSSAFLARITYLRCEHQRGAGHARNLGLQRVSTKPSDILRLRRFVRRRVSGNR